MSPTPQTPPTDRPLTAGDALRRILPITVTETPDYAELTFGDSRTQAMTMEPEVWLALNELSRPATSAASEGEVFGVTGACDEVEALACALFAHLCPGLRMDEDEDLPHYKEAAQAAFNHLREPVALASPPVSERERELEGALRRLVDNHGAYIEALPGTSGVSDLETARSLTAQPAGEGK